MPYFNNDDINILFIHIPKTGGTSVEHYFSSKFNIPLNNKSLFSFIRSKTKSNENIIINSSLQHITYNQIIKYNNVFNINFNNIKILTIVRNPYERVISDLFWQSKININTSKENVFDIMREYLVSD
jgi:glycyl-tRNA synthetase alpha subunit